MKEWLFAGACFAVLSCSSTPPEPVVPPPRPSASVSASAASPPPSALASAEPTAEPSATASTPPPPPPACPEEMVLVDGDYCTELKMTCLKSWYASSNRKVICEVFQEPTECVGQKVHKRYCMDRYEYPNKKGVRPEVMNNFYHAQVLCAKQGKRMCTETEWTMACEGPQYKPYPYGYIRDSKKCLGDLPYGNPSKEKLWKRDAAELERLWQGVVSGSQPDCKSDYGVFDMPGNADELAASEHFNDNKYDNVTTGGPWYKGVRNQCRPKIYEHDEGFQYYYLSFRCCKETDNLPTDPRAPKQIRRNQPWEKIVKLAENSLDLRPKNWNPNPDAPKPAP
ncbi:MAG: SUMF1/EgtB/PvdO family nonheme iron enzyme [Polyangiaceae bacterium]|nr:SUMF1/EgtB/PvdO family nonheme iron enzyme [Polyangiaceae bacterium]